MQITKKGYSLLEEFKAFAFKGNVVDLAVGVIIGGAFGKIIDSLVKLIIMPAISLLIPGEQGYLEWSFKYRDKQILYGQFLGEVLNFLIIALVLFLFIRKFLGWLLRSRREELKIPALTKEQELLSEIRDLLKSRTSMP